MRRTRIILSVVSVLLIFFVLIGSQIVGWLTPVTAYAGETSVPQLSVSGTCLKDPSGNVVQLHGVSTHGLAWYPQYVSYEGFKTLRDDWGVNVIRLAMYTQEYGGYCSGGDQSQLKSLIDQGVSYATQLGMYVIIDWHILSDGNPTQHESEAVDFFQEMSARYSGHTNVIYEICNEPQNSSWDSVIRPYAQTVISAIRQNDSHAVILVGTNTWSQDVTDVINDQIDDANTMYVLHFYAGTHTQYLRDKMTAALDAGVPIFVSECSICDSSGNGGINYDSANAWMDLLNSRHVSYVAWSLSNKAETSALISSSCSALSGWSDSDLSETGRWFKAAIQQSSKNDAARNTQEKAAAGIYNGVDYSAVYNRDYYYSHYADLQQAFGNDAIALLQHFVDCGMAEGRQAISTFQASVYKNNYADLYRTFGDDTRAYYLHYMQFGAAEGRNASTSLTDAMYHGIDYSPVFQASYYSDAYPDLKSTFGYDSAALLQHFVQNGMAEGRQACASFNVHVYKVLYKDLQNAFGNDLAAYYTHYLNYGIKEGRTAVSSTIYGETDYAPVYNETYYYSHYPDLQNALGNDEDALLCHFVTYGMKEGRQASSSFNPTLYKASYQDLQKAFGNNMTAYYMHYLQFGQYENRTAH